MLQHFRRRRRTERRLGRAFTALDALLPSPNDVPPGTPIEREELIAHVAGFHALIAGLHSSRWPPGAAAEVHSELAAILQEFAPVLTAEEIQALQEMTRSVIECSDAIEAAK